mgnify:CR=1 FL=1
MTAPSGFAEGVPGALQGLSPAAGAVTQEGRARWAFCVQALRLKVGERSWIDVSFALPDSTRAFVLILETGDDAARDQALSQALTARGFGTLTACLLTPEECANAEELAWHVTDLGERAAIVLEWLEHQPFRGTLPLAAVGWRTAAAVLIRLAARETQTFYALSCLEGRIDLAGAGPLLALTAPIQLLTSSATDDKPNLAAWPHIGAEKRWEHLPPPTPAGPWPEAITLTCEWFERHLPSAPKETLKK